MVDRVEELRQIDVHRPPVALLDVGLYLPDRRPRSICSRVSSQCRRAGAGQSSTVTPSMPGAPLLDLTRFHARLRLSLCRTACSRSSCLSSSCLKARCAPPAATSLPVGIGNMGEVGASAPCVLLLGPWAARHLAAYWLLLTSAASRLVLPRGALCWSDRSLPLSSTRGGQLATALGSSLPGVNQSGFDCQHHHRLRSRSPQVRTRTVGAQAPHLP